MAPEIRGAGFQDAEVGWPFGEQLVNEVAALPPFGVTLGEELERHDRNHPVDYQIDHGRLVIFYRRPDPQVSQQIASGFDRRPPPAPARAPRPVVLVPFPPPLPPLSPVH